MGAIEAKRTQESPDHLFVQYGKIDDTYTNEISPFSTEASATADKVFPALTKKLDDVVLGIYNQFKDSLPKE